jgi:hypothetical protein
MAKTYRAYCLLAQITTAEIEFQARGPTLGAPTCQVWTFIPICQVKTQSGEGQRKGLLTVQHMEEGKSALQPIFGVLT